MSGCEGWLDIEDYGKAHLIFLKKYLEYKKMASLVMIPCGVFFRAVDPEMFGECFKSWIGSIMQPEALMELFLLLMGRPPGVVVMIPSSLFTW